MKIKVVGKAHLQGTSKRTGNPYDFIQIHYLGRAPGIIGDAALTLNLDPGQYSYEKITIPGDYNVDFNGRGFVVDFQPLPAAAPGK